MRNQQHLGNLRKVDGRRIELFDKVGIPNGWVVTTNVPSGFWDKCKTPAIPMKAKRFLWVFPTKATVQMNRWLSKYGKSIMVVLIPDDETLEGYGGGLILLSDLERNPKHLLDESLKLIGEDNTLSDAKRRCAMLLYGWVDTK